MYSSTVQELRLCTNRTANRGSRGIALLFLDHGTRRGDWSASRPGRTLPPRKDPVLRWLGWLQGRSRQVQKTSPPSGFDPRTVQAVASRYTDWATRLTQNVKIPKWCHFTTLPSRCRWSCPESGVVKNRLFLVFCSLSIPAFLNRQAAVRYRALASIIPGRDRFSWNLSF